MSEPQETITPSVPRGGLSAARHDLAPSGQRHTLVNAEGTYRLSVPVETRLVIADLDGTLISAYMDDPDRAYSRWHVLKDRVVGLRLLRAVGIKLGIATNQGAIGYGYTPEEEWWAKCAAALESLELPATTPVAVCFAAPRARDARWSDPREVRRRKPAGAMLHEVMRAHWLDPRSAEDRRAVLCIGDRLEDAQAAADAGVPYQPAALLFGETDLLAEMEDLGL